jgi:hypothetical protein
MSPTARCGNAALQAGNERITLRVRNTAADIRGLPCSAVWRIACDGRVWTAKHAAQIGLRTEHFPQLSDRTRVSCLSWDTSVSPQTEL